MVYELARDHKAVGKRTEMDALFLVRGDTDSSIDLLTPRQCAPFRHRDSLPSKILEVGQE